MNVDVLVPPCDDLIVLRTLQERQLHLASGEAALQGPQAAGRGLGFGWEETGRALEAGAQQAGAGAWEQGPGLFASM